MRHRTTRLVVIAVLVLAATAAFAADSALGPGPRWYRPIRCALGDVAAETLSAEPEYAGTPIYGSIQIGDGEDSVFSIVVDLAADWSAFSEAYKAAEGKVEMAEAPARIYIDANNDEDLTNDGDGVLRACGENPRKADEFTISRGAACHVTYADGAEIDYPVNCYMFPQRGKVKGRDGAETDYGRLLFYYRGASFETTVRTGDSDVALRFYDENSDGLIVAEDGDMLGIDLNQDGEFDPSFKGPEICKLDEPFNFGGESYVLGTFGPRGGDATAAVSEDKVPEPIYIAAGEPAPDFRKWTLRHEPFYLSHQRGKVVVLDFWATWCGPCRAELPNVVKMWEDLKDDGLVLVGISLDRSDDDASARKRVRRFAPENGMAWTHIVEGKYWDSEVGDLYQVSGIPQTVLIGRDGKILVTGLRGEKLHQAAKEALEGGG